MEIRVELITMPDVDDVRAVSALRREELAHRAQEHSDAMDAKATQDIPRFIRFINQQIEEAKMAGLSSPTITPAAWPPAATISRVSPSPCAIWTTASKL